jgi:hypothetical protein
MLPLLDSVVFPTTTRSHTGVAGFPENESGLRRASRATEATNLAACRPSANGPTRTYFGEPRTCQVALVPVSIQIRLH